MADIDPTAARQVLDLPMGDNDAGATSIRHYLVELLTLVWKEGECFNGKRPFGNSDWEYELHPPLVKAGLVSGNLDKDGWADEVDVPAARTLIAAAIREMGRP